MSISSVITQLPPLPANTSERRVLFVAVEGPPLSGKTELIKKLQASLGEPEETEHTTIEPTWCPNVMLEDMRRATRHAETSEAKVVFIENYIISWMALIDETNFLGARREFTGRNVNNFLPFLRGLPVPDLIIYLSPNTATMVSRYIADKRFSDEDDFVFSNEKRTADVLDRYAGHGLFENILIMKHDPITKVTDSLNAITMRAALDTFNNPMRLY